jgi:hypothetical protein
MRRDAPALRVRTSSRRAASAREVAAVDGELGAGDVDRVVGGKEGDGSGDLLRFGAAAPRA